MKPTHKTDLPPHDVAAEAGALACLLSSNGEAIALLRQISIDDFYDARHREIFTALKALETGGRVLDLVSLAQHLRDHNLTERCGGLAYISALPDQTPSPENFPVFLETVHDRATRRAALRDAVELSELARDTAISSTQIADAARRLSDAYSRNANAGASLTVRSPDDLLAMTFDDSDCILGDRLLASGQSLVIAGAGSLGKSRLLLQLAVATIAGRPFVGLETHGSDLRWLILQAENSNRRLQMDLAALRQWSGNEWQRVNGQLAIHTLESDVDGFLSLDNSRAQQRITDAIRDSRPDVIGWDSLYNFGIGDLNKDEDMAATLLAISRITKAGNPKRSPVILHHALTGKAGASRATGYDRSSHSRNSKVLFAWTRGQINLAPGSAENNDTLVLSCAKCSNGREFSPFAVQLNPDTMIYEPAPDFDLQAWETDVSGTRDTKLAIEPERVRELCKGAMSKPDLARAVMRDCGCARGTAYRRMDAAERARLIHWTKATETYVAR